MHYTCFPVVLADIGGAREETAAGKKPGQAREVPKPVSRCDHRAVMAHVSVALP